MEGKEGDHSPPLPSVTNMKTICVIGEGILMRVIERHFFDINAVSELVAQTLPTIYKGQKEGRKKGRRGKEKDPKNEVTSI